MRDVGSSYFKQLKLPAFLRFNIEDIRIISKISPIQIAPRLISYTTLYLLNNAENMHELKIKNNLEMRIYKILNQISKEQEIKLLKRNDKYEIGEGKIEIIDGKHVKVDDRFIDVKSLEAEFNEV